MTLVAAKSKLTKSEKLLSSHCCTQNDSFNLELTHQRVSCCMAHLALVRHSQRVLSLTELMHVSFASSEVSWSKGTSVKELEWFGNYFNLPEAKSLLSSSLTRLIRLEVPDQVKVQVTTSEPCLKSLTSLTVSRQEVTLKY